MGIAANFFSTDPRKREIEQDFVARIVDEGVRRALTFVDRRVEADEVEAASAPPGTCRLNGDGRPLR